MFVLNEFLKESDGKGSKEDSDKDPENIPGAPEKSNQKSVHFCAQLQLLPPFIVSGNLILRQSDIVKPGLINGTREVNS